MQPKFKAGDRAYRVAFTDCFGEYQEQSEVLTVESVVLSGLPHTPHYRIVLVDECGYWKYEGPERFFELADDEPQCELCGSSDDELLVVWPDEALPSRLLCCRCAADDLVAEMIRQAE